MWAYLQPRTHVSGDIENLHCFEKYDGKDVALLLLDGEDVLLLLVKTVKVCRFANN